MEREIGIKYSIHKLCKKHGLEKTLEMIEDMIDSDFKFNLLRLFREKMEGV